MTLEVCLEAVTVGALEGFSLLLSAQQCDCKGIKKDLSTLNLVMQKERLEVAAGFWRIKMIDDEEMQGKKMKDNV